MNRKGWSLIAAAALATAAIAVWAGDNRAPPRPDPPSQSQAQAKTKLALLTSLPLMFAERFSLDVQPSPLLGALDKAFDVQAIALADGASLASHRLLLMAHPRAQPAEALVDLDEWVRQGGRVLLLADPRLDWHSDRVMGDKLRPPPDFADTGLLAHWGLALQGATAEGPVTREVEGLIVLTSSPGKLVSKKGQCIIAADGFVARCRLGSGQVTVVADADFLNVAGEDALDGPTGHNLELVTRELARLAR